MEGFKKETNQFEETINIKEYISLFWQWAWAIALATIIGAVIGYFVSFRTTPIYQASTVILINEAPATRSTDYTSLIVAERLSQTYAEMMTYPLVLDETILRLGLTTSSEQLAKSISARPMSDTSLMEVTVDSTDPVAAAIIANTVIEVFAKQIETIESDRFTQSKQTLEDQLLSVENEINKYTDLAAATSSELEKDKLETKIAQYREIYSGVLQSYEEVRLSEAQAVSSIVQMKPAVQPDSPISPNILRTTALAAAVGFVLSVGVIITSEMLDDTLKTPEDVSRHLGLPVLGMIDKFSKDADQRLITQQQPRSPISESFRALRTNVQFASIDHQLQSVLVTSAGPSEGKSTVAANLAVVFAQSGKSTFLIDCDFRRPSLHKYFGMKNRKGLSGLLYQSDYELNGSFRTEGVQNMSLVTTGTLPPNPAELLASEKMKELFWQMKNQYEIMIIDSPPILAVTDAAIIAPTVDGVLLVVQPGMTHISAAQQTVEQLVRANAKILGVVINALDLKRSRYAYRYGYHYYGKKKYSGYYNNSEQPESAKKKLFRRRTK